MFSPKVNKLNKRRTCPEKRSFCLPCRLGRLDVIGSYLKARQICFRSLKRISRFFLGLTETEKGNPTRATGTPTQNKIHHHRSTLEVGTHATPVLQTSRSARLQN